MPRPPRATPEFTKIFCAAVDRLIGEGMTSDAIAAELKVRVPVLSAYMRGEHIGPTTLHIRLARVLSRRSENLKDPVAQEVLGEDVNRYYDDPQYRLRSLMARVADTKREIREMETAELVA
jgi:hypothetical protein